MVPVTQPELAVCEPSNFSTASCRDAGEQSYVIELLPTERMRLLNSKSHQLASFHRPVHYAIVSHRWGAESEEVLFTDITDKARARRKSRGYHKIKGACAQAMQDGLSYVWLDTCCIDMSNNTELSEAVNSMYKWYQKSDVCYAYLHDVGDLSEFTRSVWFTRGWTLQELIAPKKLKFFTKDWCFLGTREDLIDPISRVTGISREVLQSAEIPSDVTISQKMCWAAKRQTTKVEDMAYSLLGLLGVSMVPIYGIEDTAFEDLQHRIITKSSDQTLFSWYHAYTEPSLTSKLGNDADTPPFNPTGLLATSPAHYVRSYEISEEDFRNNYVDQIKEFSYRSHFTINNNHVRILLPIKHVVGKIWKAALRCSFEPPDGDETQRPLVIYLKELDRWKYVRVHLAPDQGGEAEGNVQMPGVFGSLERLDNSELQLQGYILQKIDVLARYGELDSRARKLSSGPDSFHEVTTKSGRLAWLSRLPFRIKGFGGGERGNGTQMSGVPEMAKSSGKETKLELRRIQAPARASSEAALDPPMWQGEGRDTHHMDSPLQPPAIAIPEVGTSAIPTLDEPANGTGVTTDDFHDLTGRVTRTDAFMFASGSHGDVYRGCLDSDRGSIQVAIKTFRVYRQHDDKWARRFRREITVWLRLDHPNIVPLFGTIRDPNLHPVIPAMVCPWVGNGALSTHLEANNDLSISGRLSLANDVAHGLRYLHSNSVVHGDISGSNILVHANGRACISDFGLSTLLTSIAYSASATSATMGTVRWMAPELLYLDDSNTMPTTQSDVYSFGSIMLQILTGRMPYYYLNREPQVIIAIAKGTKPRRPDEAVVTDDRWNFIEWCWGLVQSRPSSDQIVEFTEKVLGESIGVKGE